MAQSPSSSPTTSASSSLTSSFSARRTKDESKLSYLQITIHQVLARAAAAAAEQPEGEQQGREQEQQEQQSQTSAAPPSASATIEVRILNSHPTRPFTVLLWDCPLDKHALRMRRFIVTDAATGEAVEHQYMCCLRRPPPPRDSLIEIEPGQTVSRRHTLQAPEFDIAPGQRLKIRTWGYWRGIWMVAKAELKDADLAYMEQLRLRWRPQGKRRKLNGEYTSEEVEIVVE